jgi:Uma2 family endonuclease
MGMPASQRQWTTDEVRALMDETHPAPRYELIDGELLVTPSPGSPHQAVVGALYAILRAYVNSNGLGRVFLSPADLELRPRQITQPDIFVVPPGTHPGRRWRGVRALRLAVEVLSDGSRRHDRVTKRHHYQNVGVSEYWIVDIDGGVVERWHPTDERPEINTGTLTWRPDNSVPELVIDLAPLWDEAAGLNEAD